MLNSTFVAASSSTPSIGGLIGFAILMLIIVGIVVRLIIVMFRGGKGGKGEIKEKVLRPIFKSGGVQSELYGFKPTEAHDLEPGERGARADDPGRNT